MNFKNLTFIAILAIAAGYSLFVYLQPRAPDQPLEWSTDAVAKPQPQPNDTANHTISTTPTISEKSLYNKGEDIGGNSAEFQFLYTSTAPALWPVKAPIKQVEIKRHNKIKAWVVDINTDLLDSLSVGEQLNLYIPQTQRRLTVTINSIKQGRYSESRIATIDGSNHAYSAYFTVGKTTLYGSIETPEGVFHFEKRNADDAVIYAASEIRKNLDYSVSDAVHVSRPEITSQH